IIGTIAGAIPDTAPPALLVPPDNPVALAAALDRLIGDNRVRRRLAVATRQAARDLPAWSTSARGPAHAVRGTRTAPPLFGSWRRRIEADPSGRKVTIE